MRIALYTETFLPKTDGIVNTLCNLLSHLARCGHESILFAPAGGPLRFAATPVIGLKGVSFPLYPELKLVPPLVNQHAALADFRPDLIHVLNPFSLGLAGLRHARRTGTPVVASYHTDVPGFAVRWGQEWCYGPLTRYFRWVHNRADLTLCPSEFTRATLAAQGYQRLKVWSRGVDSERFSPARSSPTWRRRLSDDHPEAPLLLYVGRLSMEKRVDWIKPVLEALPQARLAVVGDGPARMQLRRRFAGMPVRFTGYLHGADLAAAYASADLFVFPAANETLGNVVLEAMASGLPVVAPRAGGVLDHVRDGESGLLFDPESVSDLVEAATLLIQQPAAARRMGRHGRTLVIPQRWSTIMDGLLGEYAALINALSRQTQLHARSPGLFRGQ